MNQLDYMTSGYCSAAVAYVKPTVRSQRASGFIAVIFRRLAAWLSRYSFAAAQPDCGGIAEKAVIDGETGSGAHRRFTELTERYAGLINKICFTYCENAADFSDLRQDVMLNLWRGIAGFRGESAPITWIYRVAINTCISAVRSRSRRPAETPIDLIDLADEGSQDDERVVWLYESISRLAKIDRALLLMRLDGLTYDEIADVSGLSRSTAVTRIRRVIAQLARENRKEL